MVWCRRRSLTIIKMNPPDEPSLSKPVDDVEDLGGYSWRRPVNNMEFV
jgi:hypothetical protein